MSAANNKQKLRSSNRLTQQEMRSSLLLPIALGLCILLGGIGVAFFAPWSFGSSTAIFIGAILLLYLLWSIRKASWRLRIVAVLMALPAVAGITAGLVRGRSVDALIGIAITVLLLAAHRLFSTPLSYRAAYRRFNVGDIEGAQRLVNRSIESRPDFWESYQLRALIHLVNRRLSNAESDALQALAINPQAHQAHHVLGQIYLMKEQYSEAEGAYVQALENAPGYGLYVYNLGLSEYRQEDYSEAVSSFAMATKRNLPREDLDLQAHYYLSRGWEEMGRNDEAHEATLEMLKYRGGLQAIKRFLETMPDDAYFERQRVDISEIEKRFSRNDLENSD